MNASSNDAIIENRNFDSVNQFQEMPKIVTNNNTNAMPHLSPGPFAGPSPISPFFSSNNLNPLLNNHLQQLLAAQTGQLLNINPVEQ